MILYFISPTGADYYSMTLTIGPTIVIEFLYYDVVLLKNHILSLLVVLELYLRNINFNLSDIYLS